VVVDPLRKVGERFERKVILDPPIPHRSSPTPKPLRNITKAPRRCFLKLHPRRAKRTSAKTRLPRGMTLLTTGELNPDGKDLSLTLFVEREQGARRPVTPEDDRPRSLHSFLYNTRFRE